MTKVQTLSRDDIKYKEVIAYLRQQTEPKSLPVIAANCYASQSTVRIAMIRMTQSGHEIITTEGYCTHANNASKLIKLYQLGWWLQS